MPRELPLSVLIPVKNDADNLRACLEGLKGWVNEVVVVDSQSQDETSSVVEDFGGELLQFHWEGGFPQKRNWALMNHDFRNDWVLLLDADERPTPAFFEEVETILKEPQYKGYWLTFQNFFMGRQIRGDDFRKIALIRKGEVFYEKLDEDRWSNLDMEVHEHPIVKGGAGVINTPIPHYDFRGLSSSMSKHLDYADWEAHKFFQGRLHREQLSFRQKVKYALLDSWALGPLFFFYLYVLRCGFLDGRVGLTFCIQKWVYFWNLNAKITNLRVQEAGLS